MRRTVTMLMIGAALAMPVVAIGDDQTVPPEAHWTPLPPARPTVNVNRWASLLVDQGMIPPMRRPTCPSHRRLRPRSKAVAECGPGKQSIAIPSGVRVVSELGWNASAAAVSQT
jgi:hypothetical protein